MENLTNKSPEVIEFIANLQSRYAKVHKERFPSLPVNQFVAEDRQKVIAIISQNENGNDRQIYCFIANQDYDTKQLGEVCRGDILKPASWKAPTKGARGNLFDTEKGFSRLGLYGPDYNTSTGLHVKI